MSDCLITFPSTAALTDRCPRCNGEAGDHPAPIDLMSDPEASIHGRPTLREALA
jgi:hypothetical protein